eukprot:COSAG01_NODE_5121_length_4471_cov_8.084629_4_plen_49_part_00
MSRQRTLALSAHVSVNGTAVVILRHVGGDGPAINVEGGLLRVLVTRLE